MPVEDAARPPHRYSVRWLFGVVLLVGINLGMFLSVPRSTPVAALYVSYGLGLTFIAGALLSAMKGQVRRDFAIGMCAGLVAVSVATAIGGSVPVSVLTNGSPKMPSDVQLFAFTAPGTAITALGFAIFVGIVLAGFRALRLGNGRTATLTAVALAWWLMLWILATKVHSSDYRATYGAAEQGPYGTELCQIRRGPCARLELRLQSLSDSLR